MASIAVEHHATRGERLLEAGDWEAAERAFREALWQARGVYRPRLLARRATALLRCPASWEEKAGALLEANQHGCDSPQFWALSLRSYLLILDGLDGRSVELSKSSRTLLQEVRNGTASLVEEATSAFQRALDERDRTALGWAAALVSIADWLYDFEGVESGRFGRHPYRQIAEMLYRPVASSDMNALFDDSGEAPDVARDVIHRARRQLARFSPASGRAGHAAAERRGLGWALWSPRYQ